MTRAIRRGRVAEIARIIGTDTKSLRFDARTLREEPRLGHNMSLMHALLSVTVQVLSLAVLVSRSPGGLADGVCSGGLCAADRCCACGGGLLSSKPALREREASEPATQTACENPHSPLYATRNRAGLTDRRGHASCRCLSTRWAACQCPAPVGSRKGRRASYRVVQVTVGKLILHHTND